MGLVNIDGEKQDLRGRPTKGLSKMTVERNIRMDPTMYRMLEEKCRRIGCSVADGIREGIKLFLKDKRY